MLASIPSASRHQEIRTIKNASTAPSGSELIGKQKVLLEEAGSKVLFDTLRSRYPEKDGVDVGKLMLGLTLPPLFFYWGRRDLSRYESICNDQYKKILKDSLERLDDLFEMPFSHDWESDYKRDESRIYDDFLQAVRAHSGRWLLKNNR